MRLMLALFLAAAPALAQDSVPVPMPEGDGSSLVEEGAKLVLRGLLTEMQPALEDMARTMDEMRPALEGFGEEVGPKIRQLIALIDDFRNYDAPVMLPNGDILIRRNAPRVPLPGVAPGPNGEIDL